MVYNPAYASGGTVERAAAAWPHNPELLHSHRGWTLHRHRRSLRLLVPSRLCGHLRHGSGKSLAFLRLLISGLLRDPGGKPGIKAVIVYPMNALINSQLKSLEDDYRKPYEKRRVGLSRSASPSTRASPRMIPGGISTATRPDILLTNYMMLELMLTRGGDADLKRSIYANLRYLALVSPTPTGVGRAPMSLC